ncbi:MAG: strictosidine synthase family protein [Spirochaetes bacterium]|nr:strictosidine synthase family protein [Spirochaetota bacterium]
MKRTRVLGIIGIAALSACAVFAVKTLRDAGEFDEVQSRCACRCRAVTGVPGPEDITVHFPTGIAYIAESDRRALQRGEKTRGAIFSYDTKSPHPLPVRLPDDLSNEFHPHGIGLLADRKSGHRLFAVNHRRAGDAVEIFLIEKNRLHHLATVAHPLLRAVNDVLPVGPDRFYATIDHGNESAIGRTVEEFLRLPLSGVVYCRGGSCRAAARGIAYANGINASPDGLTVYVAASTEKRIHAFTRNPADGSLTPQRVIDADKSVDNIEVDASGTLWVAGQPKLLTSLRHAGDGRILSPSEAFTVAVGGDTISTVYRDSGRQLSSSSVVAPFAGGLSSPGGFLVGAIYTNRFIDCRCPVGFRAMAGPPAKKCGGNRNAR